AGIAVGQTAVVNVQNTIKERDKLTGLGIAAEHKIDSPHDLVQVIDVIHVSPQRSANRCHDQARRDSLPTDIGHDQSEVVTLQGKKVEEVASKFVAGDVNGRQVQARDLGRLLRNHPLLDVNGHRHLLLKSLGLEGFGEQAGILNSGTRLGGDGFEEV